MKKLFTLLMVLFIASPALAEDDVKISGSVEIQYRSSKDIYDDAIGSYPSNPDNGETGGDVIRPEELYLKLTKKIDKGVEVLLKFDGADMDKDGDDKKYLEEAQLIFTDIGPDGFTIVAGKDEMPFGQDYEKFMFSSATHGLEIDKVWGLHAIYNFKKLGTIAAAVFEKDRAVDTKIEDSFAARVTIDKFIKNLSVEASMARIGEDEAAGIEKDETRLNTGAVLKWGDFIFHAERSLITNYGNLDDYDLDVVHGGVDFKFKDFLFKVRKEDIEHDFPAVPPGDGEEMKFAAGADYYFSKKVFVSFEVERTKWDVADDTDETLFGVKYIF
jgi:hypothetical protein